MSSKERMRPDSAKYQGRRSREIDRDQYSTGRFEWMIDVLTKRQIIEITVGCTIVVVLCFGFIHVLSWFARGWWL